MENEEKVMNPLPQELEVKVDARVREMVDEMMKSLDLTKATPRFHSTEPDKEKTWKSFGEFLFCVKNRPDDARLKTGVNEGVDSAGGFAVPEEFASVILSQAAEMAVIRPNGAFILPMASDTKRVPSIEDESHASSVYGGIVAYWTEEKGTLSATQPTFGQKKLTAKKLTGYTYASNELLEDNAVGLEALLMRLFAEAISWYEDDAFVSGDGVGKPLGILSSGSLLAVNRSAASACAIADLGNMFGRILPKSQGRAVWLANNTVLTKLIQLGSTYITWMGEGNGNGGITKAPPARLLGRPLFFTEKCSALGTAGDIILADLGYYLIGDRKGLEVASSTHARFTTDETAWKFVKRVDGQPWVDFKFTPANGDTLSPFVTLYSATTGGD